MMNENELKKYTDQIVNLLSKPNMIKYRLNLDEFTKSLLIDDIELNKDSKILIDEFLLSNLDSRTSQEIYLDNLIENFLQKK